MCAGVPGRDGVLGTEPSPVDMMVEMISYQPSTLQDIDASLRKFSKSGKGEAREGTLWDATFEAWVKN